MSSKASLVRRSQRSARHLKYTESVRRVAHQILDDASLYPDHARPRTRADCIDGPRPCPFVGCRHHLAIDVNRSGSIHHTGARESCVLDVAEGGPRPLIEVGHIIGVTRERVRQLETIALRKLQARAAASKHLREAIAGAG